MKKGRSGSGGVFWVIVLLGAIWLFYPQAMLIPVATATSAAQPSPACPEIRPAYVFVADSITESGINIAPINRGGLIFPKIIPP